MIHDVSVRPTAKVEIYEAAAYIAQDNVDAACRLIDAIEDTFKLLARSPRIGRLWEPKNPKYKDIRVLGVPGFRRYLIFYRSTKSEIEILHVYHASRNIKALFEE